MYYNNKFIKKFKYIFAKVNIKMLESGQNKNVGKPTFLFCPY